ncbi:MAG: acetate kinase [Micrococcaceae bacterium]|nr:acetate kinase [Micrococcaceae bacterium]
MLILVLNSGSSSIKYQVRETANPNPGTAGLDATDGTGSDEVLIAGTIERIGEAGTDDGGQDSGVRNHTEALERIGQAVGQALHGRGLDAVGHRVVHGGERFSAPVLINNEITRAIERLNPLAPLHNPASVLGIRAITAKWPDLPQVAVFDTAFHRTLPEHAWRYAVPDELYRNHGIRRYGFHGTSHQYVAARAARFLELPEDGFSGVIAHLGNGASVTAIAAGQSVDTSMGFTPLAGLVMGTRSGDIDPSILLFLQRQGMDADAIDELLNRRSGLAGLAGNNDMRSVVEAADAGGRSAQLALDVAGYRLAKYIGAYHVAVGGAQAVVFTAGIGENSWQFRANVVERLAALGIILDVDANRAPGRTSRRISAQGSAIPVLVVPTDEERAIAEATAALVSGL